jgi:hypothetical protein
MLAAEVLESMGHPIEAGRLKAAALEELRRSSSSDQASSEARHLLTQATDAEAAGNFAEAARLKGLALRKLAR